MFGFFENSGGEGISLVQVAGNYLESIARVFLRVRTEAGNSLTLEHDDTDAKVEANIGKIKLVAPGGVEAGKLAAANGVSSIRITHDGADGHLQSDGYLRLLGGGGGVVITATNGEPTDARVSAARQTIFYILGNRIYCKWKDNGLDIKTALVVNGDPIEGTTAERLALVPVTGQEFKDSDVGEWVKYDGVNWLTYGGYNPDE